MVICNWVYVKPLECNFLHCYYTWQQQYIIFNAQTLATSGRIFIHCSYFNLVSHSDFLCKYLFILTVLYCYSLNQSLVRITTNPKFPILAPSKKVSHAGASLTNYCQRQKISLSNRNWKWNCYLKKETNE